MNTVHWRTWFFFSIHLSRCYHFHIIAYILYHLATLTPILGRSKGRSSHNWRENLDIFRRKRLKSKENLQKPFLPSHRWIPQFQDEKLTSQHFFYQDKERKRRQKATKDFTFIVEILKPLVDNATQNNFIRIKKSKGGERLKKKIFYPRRWILKLKLTTPIKHFYQDKKNENETKNHSKRFYLHRWILKLSRYSQKRGRRLEREQPSSLQRTCSEHHWLILMRLIAKYKYLINTNVYSTKAEKNISFCLKHRF